VDLSERSLAVQWNPATGFGISDVSNENFAEGPDEVLLSFEQAKQRIDTLLNTTERTSPPLAVLLSRLREQRGLTQNELAQRLGVQQATVSGLERRDDVRLSTLRRVLEALGGGLEVYGVFPDARYRIVGPESGATQDHEDYKLKQRRQNKTYRKITCDEANFESLREAGTLQRATAIASIIHTRHSVIEIP
jgi:transcriptional regulator with XRE-family HTH domain